MGMWKSIWIARVILNCSPEPQSAGRRSGENWPPLQITDRDWLNIGLMPVWATHIKLRLGSLSGQFLCGLSAYNSRLILTLCYRVRCISFVFMLQISMICVGDMFFCYRTTMRLQIRLGKRAQQTATTARSDARFHFPAHALPTGSSLRSEPTMNGCRSDRWMSTTSFVSGVTSRSVNSW